MDDLRILTPVELNEVWETEPQHFTPWLAREKNLTLLGNALGIELELVDQERRIGNFRADILCKNIEDDSWVLIENQLEATDHKHAGQLLTYAAGWMLVQLSGLPRRSEANILRCLTGRIGLQMKGIVSLVLK